DHRRFGSGLCVYSVVGRVYRYGHSRSSLIGARCRKGSLYGRPAGIVRLCLLTGGFGMNLVHLLGAAIGLGMVGIGAGWGIGRLASAAAEGIARQPSAATNITGAVNLPLFLLEGVAILAEVFILLIVFK